MVIGLEATHAVFWHRTIHFGKCPKTLSETDFKYLD